MYYTHESPIPGDIDRVARLIGMREHSEIVSEILKEFFVMRDGSWHQDRCDKEIATYQAKAQRARKANAARWSDEESETDLKSESVQIPTNNQEPRTNPKNQDKPLVLVGDLDCDEFRSAWADYEQHRRDLKIKPLKAKSIESQIKEMSSWGKETAIAAIRTSIRNGWQGIFFPGKESKQPIKIEKPANLNKFANAFSNGNNI